MTKKDYELIAGVLSRVYWHYESRMALLPDHEVLLNDITIEFVRALSQENPKFNQKLFVNACRKES